MKPHALAPLAGLALLAACSPDFTGPEQVEGLRVLAVQAEPPELGAPGDSSDPAWPPGAAALRSLVAHPGFADDAAPRAVVLHLACTPVPGEAAGTACTTISDLSDPAALLAAADLGAACTDPGLGTAGKITFAGLESCSRDGCGALTVLRDPADAGSGVTLAAPSYRLPDGWSLSGLAADSPDRVLGLDVVDLAVAIEAAPEDVAPTAAAADGCAALQAVLARLAEAWTAGTGAHVAALKWIHVRGPDMPAASAPDRNPSLSGITLGGAALPAPDATPLSVEAGRSADLLPVLPAPFSELRQTYQRFDTDGHYLDTRQEDWAYAWFTTHGDLDHAYTHAEDDPNAYEPRAGRALVWVVVRDLRGGVAWTAGAVEAP